MDEESPQGYDDNDDNNDDDLNLYTKSQKIVLQVLPLFTAPLSAIGSALIIYTIVKHGRQEIKTFQRFMLGMSLLDFVSSMGMILLGFWAVPQGTEFVVGARGNNVTCRASFFIMNLLFSSMWYSTFLAIYFMLVVRFDWPQKRIARFVEPFGHCLAFVAPLSSSIAEVVRKTVHPMYVLPGFCWTLNDPLGCTPSEDDPNCTEPQTSSVHQGVILILFGLIIVCMALILCQVRRTDHYVDRYEVGEDNHRRENTKMITKEALLYIGAFFLVFCPAAIVMSLDDKPASTSRNRAGYFAAAFLLKLLTPLQGLFNAIIYLRGRLVTLVQQQGEGQFTLDLFVAYLNASENFRSHEGSIEQVRVSTPQQTFGNGNREAPTETGGGL